MIKNTLRDFDMPPEIDSYGGGLSVLICSAYEYWFNWMAYASWYSVYKNLPNAKIAVTCSRSCKIEQYYYNWVYKCNDLRFNLHKNVGDKANLPYLNKIYGVWVALKEGLVKQPLVVLDADMMALRTFSSSTLSLLSDSYFATTPCPYKLDFSGTPVGPIWFFNRVPLEKIEETINTIATLEGHKHLDLLALSKVFGDRVKIIEDFGNEAKDHKITTFTHYNNGCGGFTKADWEKGKIVPPFHTAYALQSPEMSPNEKKVLALWKQMADFWEAANQIKL